MKKYISITFLIGMVAFLVSCKAKESNNQNAPESVQIVSNRTIKDLIGVWQTKKTWSDAVNEYPIFYKIEESKITRTWHKQQMHCDEIQLSVTGPVYTIKCKMHYPDGEFDNCQFIITRGADSTKALLDEVRGDVYLTATEVLRQ